MIDQAISAASESALTEDEVVAYLRLHPEFFSRHEYLLDDIRLTHSSGSAISLMERQVQVFREQRDDLQRELRELFEIAQRNDIFFEKSKRLLMCLLEAENINEVIAIMENSILKDFKLDHCSLLLLERESTGYFTDNEGVKVVGAVDAERILGSLLDSSKAICGQFQEKQLNYLFPSAMKKVGSAAVIPIRNSETLGIFSLGSCDSEYFDSSMGSLFLSYISDALSRLLPPLFVKEQANRSEEVVVTGRQ